ncbi:MAG TPA: iron-containing alcohol dehydrogenase, partial [Firmicutes bacterium]|nr:iron-containing alcohol dehydrogenase [Bacillota bacterium]
IELGAEKRSIRGLPPPRLIIADPALTDELPFESTAIAAVDALAQALEVLTNAAATSAVQQVALAAFAALARGIEDLILAAESAGEPPHPATDRPVAIESPTRDMLSWGSLLMGIAFAHARLGLPHALVHFCSRFGLRHGHMVGLLLGAGLAVQARGDRETEARLARAAQHLPTARSENADELLSWVNDRISRLFALAGLPTSLAGAGLRSADLAWIMEHELAHRPHYGIPPRPAAPADLKAVLLQAHHPT